MARRVAGGKLRRKFLVTRSLPLAEAGATGLDRDGAGRDRALCSRGPTRYGRCGGRQVGAGKAGLRRRRLPLSALFRPSIGCCPGAAILWQEAAHAGDARVCRRRDDGPIWGAYDLGVLAIPRRLRVDRRQEPVVLLMTRRRAMDWREVARNCERRAARSRGGAALPRTCRRSSARTVSALRPRALAGSRCDSRTASGSGWIRTRRSRRRAGPFLPLRESSGCRRVVAVVEGAPRSAG